MEQVEAVCDRVAIIDRGQLVAIDSIDGLRDATETGETLYVFVPDLDGGTVERVARLDGVEDASIDGDRLRVTIGDRSKFEVLETIDDAGVPVEDFEVVTSSLEDLFVRYTNDEQEVRA